MRNFFVFYDFAVYAHVFWRFNWLFVRFLTVLIVSLRIFKEIKRLVMVFFNFSQKNVKMVKNGKIYLFSIDFCLLGDLCLIFCYFAYCSCNLCEYGYFYLKFA